MAKCSRVVERGGELGEYRRACKFEEKALNGVGLGRRYNGSYELVGIPIVLEKACLGGWLEVSKVTRRPERSSGARTRRSIQNTIIGQLSVRLGQTRSHRTVTVGSIVELANGTGSSAPQ